VPAIGIIWVAASNSPNFMADHIQRLLLIWLQ
jgi:hypothetical protein